MCACSGGLGMEGVQVDRHPDTPRGVTHAEFSPVNLQVETQNSSYLPTAPLSDVVLKRCPLLGGCGCLLGNDMDVIVHGELGLTLPMELPKRTLLLVALEHRVRISFVITGILIVECLGDVEGSPDLVLIDVAQLMHHYSYGILVAKIILQVDGVEGRHGTVSVDPHDQIGKSFFGHPHIAVAHGTVAIHGFASGLLCTGERAGSK